MAVIGSLLVIVVLVAMAGFALGWWPPVRSLSGTAGGSGVTVLSFTAEGKLGVAKLDWETEGESDIQGFHLYRTKSGTGSRVPVNSSLIKASGRGGGASYHFEDVTAERKTTYKYDLVAVGKRGEQVVLESVEVKTP